MNDDKSLALYGGSPIRPDKFPSRNQFGNAERQAILDAFDYYNNIGVDFGVQNVYETKYCQDFVEFQNAKGYADSVCSGTAAIYVALKSLNLDQGTEVLVSSVTDPGSINPIILSGLSPKLIDTQKNSYNICLDTIKDRVSDKTKLLFLVHVGGKSIDDIEQIAIWAKEKGILLLEDCSQAHGAYVNNQRVGSFGDISVFSTMFSKNHSTGSNGGTVYTKNYDLYKNVRMYSDKGKDIFDSNYNPKDPGTFKLPALNLNNDELSCAIGIQTLKKLDETNRKRREILFKISEKLNGNLKTIKMLPVSDNDAPFFWPFNIDVQKITCTKEMFTNAIEAEGININKHYSYIVSDWGWCKKYLSDSFSPQNAIELRNNSFNLLFNENYSEKDIDDICLAFTKIEEAFL